MMRFLTWCVCGTVAAVTSIFAQSTAELSRAQAVEASVQVQENPPRLTFVWNAASDATGYRVYRRNGVTFQEVAALPANATSWADGSVALGERYEYRIVKTTQWDYVGQTYLTAGVRANTLDDTGRVLLLVRDNIAGALGGELENLRRTLVLEGWDVHRQDVAGSATVPQVKAVVLSHWQASAGKLKAVLMIGRVPVPYSGNIIPDGHENHKGAWPADGFYADVDGTWTDSTVNVQTSERQDNWNVPGDGKYDQGTYPTNVDVAVGRVDFFEMTCFANKTPSRSEVDLTRQYINKNIQFRSGQVQLTRRGLVLDHFGLREGNGVAASGYRNMAAAFGKDNAAPMELNTYFSRLRSESALMTWGAGGGSYYYCSGIGTADDFALTDVNVVFTLWLGSYFGDWNNESNWMRAALGSGKVLISTYAGIPHTLFHNMALGGTIGDSFVLTQNNKPRDVYLPDSQGLNEVHQALLGDPTLRLFPRPPVSNLTAQGAQGSATLNFAPGSGSGYLGVHVYRGTSANGPFQRVTSNPVGGSTYSDTVAAGTYVYLVRPVWLEATGSGTFLNQGLGAATGNVVVGQPVIEPPKPTTPPLLSGQRVSPGVLRLNVTAQTGVSFVVEWTERFNGWTGLTTNTGNGQVMNFDVNMTGSQKAFRARY